MAHQVETMFSFRTVPWHGLGRIIEADAPPKSDQAIIYAGLNWNVEKRPALFTGNDGSIITVPNRFVTVRDSDEATFGVVGADYRIVQNIEAFDFADELLGEGLRYETAGSLHGGKKIFLLGKMPSTEILGDKVEPYIILTNSHDGCGAIKIAMTPVRVVCQNTLNLALSGAKRTWSARHVGDMKAKLDAARTTLKLAGIYMDNMKKQAEILVAKKIDDRQVSQICEALLMPKADEMTDRQFIAASARIAELKTRYNEAPDLAGFRGTAWGFIGAVSDMVTHAAPARRTQQYQETLMEGAIGGYDLINEAQNLLMAA